MIAKKPPFCRRLTKPLPEGGYTLQALIIIAILVLSATVAFTVIYAILRDSTDNIVGGSETFDGLPSGPQNLEIVTSPLQEDDTTDITISWDAPSFLGENALLGYLPTVRVVGANAGVGPDSCRRHLNLAMNRPSADDAVAEPGFANSNMCNWDDFNFADGTDYELSFTINLSEIGGVTFTQRLPLSDQLRLPQNIQTSGTENAIVVSWESVGENVAYRFHIDHDDSGNYTDGDYVICVAPSGVPPNTLHTQEIPDITLRPSVVWQSPVGTFPQAEMSYEIALAVSSTEITGKVGCETDNNFAAGVTFKPDEDATEFLGQFGSPAVPEFSVSSVNIASLALPQVTITSQPCDDGLADSSTLFTFYWSEVGQPEGEQEISFFGCEHILPIGVQVGSERSYSIRGTAGNDFGVSQVSPSLNWVATADSGTPAPPRNIRAIWSGPTQLAISWDPPELESNAVIDSYSLTQGMVDGASRNCLLGTSIIFASETQSVIFASDAQSPTSISGIPILDLEPITTALGNLGNNGPVPCITIQSMANGVESSPIEIRVPQPPSGSVTIGTTEVSVSWQATNPSEISHYIATLSLGVGCPDKDSVIRRTIVPNFSETGNIITETFPLFLGNNRENYVCVAAIYRDGSRQSVFVSGMIMARTSFAEVEMLRLTHYPDPDDPDDSVLLRLEGVITELDTRYANFFVCLDVLLPSGGDMWGNEGEGAGRAELEISQNPGFNYGEGPFTYDPVQFSDTGGPMNITAAQGSGEEFNVRLWASTDNMCPYPETEPLTVPITITPPQP